MPLLMVRNDIVNMQTDAIVNPANEKLLEGSGVSYAIFQAAGEELLTKACKKLGRCKLGEAVSTPGFNLSAKYIIHAVGPMWKDGCSNEETVLYQTYSNSLKLARKKKCESIAFPLLSSGNLGFPKDRATKVAISAISDFLMKYEMLVYLVLYDRESVSVSEKILGSVEAYIDDHYIEENEEVFERDVRTGRIERLRMQCTEALPVECMQMAMQQPSKRSLDSLMENLDETFSQMLLRLIDERNLKDSYVYKKANVDRRLFSKIRNNVNYAPTKKTVIAFAIALELSLDETIDLLSRAGYALSHSSKFDVIIQFFLENKSYDIFEINEVLFQYDQPILGE